MASLKETLTALADAIRKRSGKTEKMTLAEMPAEVAALPSGGRDDELISGDFKDGTYENDSVTKIRDNIFSYCTDLASVSFPNVVSIGNTAFSNCTGLSSVSFPNVVSIGEVAFLNCTSLASVSFPKLEEITGYGTFSNCTKLTSVDSSKISIVGERTFYNCPIQYFNFENLNTANNSSFYGTKLTEINAPKMYEIPYFCFSAITTLKKAIFIEAYTVFSGAFESCESLAIVILQNVSLIYTRAFYDTALNMLVIGTENTTEVCTLDSSDVFTNTPIASGTGYIYVPDSLVDQYKSATNWSVYANQIKGLSEKPAE